MALRRVADGLEGSCALLDGDGDLLDDLQAEAFEGGDVHGGVGEEPDALDAEVREDLAAEADSAEDAAGAVLSGFTGAEFAVQDEAAGLGRIDIAGRDRAAGRERGVKGFRRKRLVVNGEATRGVVEIKQGAAALFSNHAHGVVEDLAATAVCAEDVAGGAAGVDADEHGMGAGWAVVRCAGEACGAADEGGTTARTEVATHQGEVALSAVDFRLVGDHAEFAVASLDAGFARAHDIALMAEAVTDELGDGEDAEAVLLAERDEVRDAGHFAVVAHDFADDAGGGETGHAGEVDGGLCLAGADKDAAAAGAEGEDVAGTGEVRGVGFG